MSVFFNLSKGFKTVRSSWKTVVLLFIFNFLFTLVLAVPLYKTLRDSIGRSEVGLRLSEGFDYLWWEEFRDQSRGAETTFSPSIFGKGAVLDNYVNVIDLQALDLPDVILFLGFLYILFHTFLSGGILTIFKQDNSCFSLKVFFSGAGHLFFRFFFIVLFSWIFFWSIFLLRGFFFSVVDRVSETARSEILPFILGLVFSIVTYFLFLFIQMVFDYARIRTVLTESRNILNSILEALRFVFRHLGATLGLFYLLFLTNLVATVFFLAIRGIIPQTSGVGVFIGVLLQQLFIAVIIAIRCWLYSSQMELHRYLQPPI